MRLFQLFMNTRSFCDELENLFRFFHCRSKAKTPVASPPSSMAISYTSPLKEVKLAQSNRYCFINNWLLIFSDFRLFPAKQKPSALSHPLLVGPSTRFDYSIPLMVRVVICLFMCLREVIPGSKETHIGRSSLLLLLSLLFWTTLYSHRRVSEKAMGNIWWKMKINKKA